MKNPILYQIIAFPFFIMFMLLSDASFGQNSIGSIIANTNPALPSDYNFQEYVFPEPDDQGDCLGIQNITAAIDEIYLSQTHRHAIGHPLFFTIGERPALLQLAVTGTGVAPDVQVEGILNGTSLGTLCLKGPTNLSATINLEQPNFSDYFSVTLPKAWIKEGLELNLSAGDDARTLTQADLQITPYTELNLVLVNMDIMDYNHLPHRTPMFDDFLEELAAAIPASVIRFGIFPETLRLPSLALNNQAGNPVVVSLDALVEDNDLHTGMINLVANDFLANMQQALGDSPNTIYFGNTLNLDPGGWGGNGNFVSFDYTGTFIHELGHALSLPHWGEEAFGIPNPEPYEFLYPYGGELGEEAGGRGAAWNFNQDIYEFISPTCQDDNSQIGIERSDCMQREFPCLETRSDGAGPWDGFGDFSAKAINNYLLGSEREFGQVEDRGALRDFHFIENVGQPLATLVNNERVFTRHSSQPQNTNAEDYIKLPGTEQIEQDVYLISGSAHGSLTAANIIYEPIKYKGTLLPIIDPTNPTIFSTLQNLELEDAPELFGQPRDLTLKLTYIDGTIAHTVVPFQSFERFEADIPEQVLAPEYFSVVVPGDKLLCNVELYHREFIVLYDDINEPGNINYPGQNITAANFMNAATLMATLDHSCNCPGTPDYIAPGTPCDDGNPYTINDVEDGFCNCEGDLVDIGPCGLISNGQFEANLEGWGTWGCDATSINGEAAFENIEPFDAGIGQAPFDFNMDEQYTINFEAYAAQPRTIEVVVGLDEAPWTEYLRETVNLSTTKQNYELSFTFSGNSTTNGGMSFELNGNEANVFLDNVCLEEDACEQGTTIIGPIIDKTYQHETSIIFDATISAGLNTTFQAGNSITLQSGFHAESGATFHARIADCFSSNTIVSPTTARSHPSLGQSAKEQIKRAAKQSQQLSCCAAHAPNTNCGGYTHKKSSTTSNPFISPLHNTASLSPNLDLSTPIVSILEMQVFPNPLLQKGRIRLQVNEPTQATIHLLDLNGRLVKELYNGPLVKGGSDFSFQRSNIPAGLYLVAFTATKERLFQKIVIE